jgi:hypothetical protein
MTRENTPASIMAKSLSPKWVKAVQCNDLLSDISKDISGFLIVENQTSIQLRQKNPFFPFWQKKYW